MGLLGVFLLVFAELGKDGFSAAAQPDKGPTILRPKGPALIMPAMNSANGHRLFAAKGCVICHSVNGIGGSSPHRLDYSRMPPMMNPFNFVTRRLRGAPAMIALQEKDLGYRIESTGEELADLTAFSHDEGEHRNFPIPTSRPPFGG